MLVRVIFFFLITLQPLVAADENTVGTQKPELQKCVSEDNTKRSCADDITVLVAADEEAEKSREIIDGGDIHSLLFGFIHRAFRDPTAVFTFLIFLATVGLFCATRALVKGAEESSRKQLRAYIAVSLSDFVNAPQGIAERISIYLRLRNCGQTPAKKIKYAIACASSRRDAQHEHAFTMGTTNFTLAPGEDWNERMIRDSRFTKETAEKIMHYTPDLIESGSDEMIYIFGRVEYEDVFGTAQFSNFCYEWIVTGQLPHNHRFRKTEDHNDAS